MTSQGRSTFEKLFQGWIVLYAIGVILCPAIKFHGKLIYAAEWMLIFPIFLIVCEWSQGRWIKPPRSLLALWLGLTIVYLSGQFRGNLAYQMSLYKDLNNIENEHFSWIQDGIRWIRWSLLFSLPWVFSHFRTVDPSRIKSLFLRTLKISIAISAFLAIAERLGFINLAPIYLQPRDPFWWNDRSYGTFTGPLEASLVYGLQVVLIANEVRSNWRKHFSVNMVTGTLSLIALRLTLGFSSIVALAVTLTSMVFCFGSRWSKIAAASAITVGSVSILAFVPTETILWKLNSLYQRTWTWTSWINLLPRKPWLIVSGIGFSNLNVDNSCIMMLISGGLLWFVPLYFWMKRITCQMTTDLQFAFLFWTISWITLDSIGYWGIGRVMLMLISIKQIRTVPQFTSLDLLGSERCLTGLKTSEKKHLIELADNPA